MNNKLKDYFRKDQEILIEAVAAVVNRTGIRLELLKKQIELRPGYRADAILRMNVDGQWVKIIAEVKKSINTMTVMQLKHTFEEYKGKWALVTTHVTNAMARTLREMKIQFFDVAGNAYLDIPPVYVFIQGNKLPEHWRVTEKKKDIFGIAGLKVIFTLLIDDKLIQAPYREIARKANVGLGTIVGVLEELEKQGFLINLEPGRRKLINRRGLLEKWVIEYTKKLRPKLLLGRYATNDPDLWRKVDPRQFGAVWGGEIAAAKMTDYLKPEIITFYTNRPYNNLLIALKLFQDKRGTVEVREQFWKMTENEPNENLAHPILVYADLLATEEARNIETARKIFDEHIERYFRKD